MGCNSWWILENLKFLNILEWHREEIWLLIFYQKVWFI